MRIDSPLSNNAVMTGSFSGSFTGIGNFTGLEADSVEFANVLNKPTLISGSAQIAADISGSFTSLSASIASDIAGLDGNYATDAELNASSSALITAYQGADTALSSSVAADIASNLSAIGTLQTDSATKSELNTSSSALTAAYRSELNASSSALISAYGSADTALSSSVASDIASNLSAIGTLQTDSATKAELNASSSALISAYGSADTALSSSLAADIASNLSSINSIGSFTASLDTDLTTLSLPANTTISTFGASLVDDADASAARTTLGVDAAGTDNSTDVTLVTTSHDYLSITGQAITLGTVDISDDTNLTAGTGVTLTGDTLSIGQAVGTGDSVTFASLTTTGNVTIQGDLSVLGDAVEIQVGSLSIEDKNILVASGAADSAAADGAGITIGGANESLTWNHANSRFNLSDDLNVEGNITLTGTVDGRDVAADGLKLDGIATNANNYSLPEATSTVRGGIELFSDTDQTVAANAVSTTAGRTYGIQLNAAGQAVVNVPWVDTDTTYTVGDGGLTQVNFTTARRDKLDGIESSAKDDQTITAGTGLTGGGTGDVTISHADTSTQASVNNSGRTFIQDITLDDFGHVTAITSATDSDTYVGTVTSVATGTGLTGGTITSTGTISLSHLGFQTLTDPNADRIAFWDDSAGSFAWLSAGTNITISGTTISATDTNTTYSAGTGISLVGTTFSNSGVTSITAGTGISVNASTGGVTVTNTITNNNQLTNGAGYTTYSANQALDTTSNVHHEGLMIGQTTGATANTIRCVGDVVAYYSSDAQFKDNVQTLEGSLDKVKAIRGVRFDWNDKQDVHTGHDIGVIAQEVEVVLPELVHYREHNDSKAVDYVKLTAVLIEAVKELAAKVEELEKK